MKNLRRVAATAALGAVTVASLAACSADGPVETTIVVDPVEGLSETFALGVDVSSVLSLEESGVVFRDEDGNEGDPFEILADAGVTDVRVRVWNDPFDDSGAGYGGGNVDTERAVEMGRRATEAGMSVLVNFHYSDFWADPGKQQSPKAWEGMSDADRAAATGDFTHEALEAFAEAGVDVTMVQVGNETNNGMAGMTGWPGITAAMNAGAAATRDVFPDAKVAVHFTEPQRENEYDRVGKILDNFEVDYDVFISSYYPYWHGSLENLTAVLNHVAATFDKEVMVGETSWVYSLEDYDGFPNVISSKADATAYPVSAQGQAMAFRDIVQAVADVEGGAGVGVFYWEPAWLPVGPADDAAGNAVLWEQFGSGWATSAAASYDPDDAGEFYGGSGWDNQALFAADGTALASLHMFQYVRTGATAPLAVLEIVSPAVDAQLGQPVEMPATVTVRYNDGTAEDVAVEWAEGQVPEGELGAFEVSGVTAEGDDVTAIVTVRPLNDLLNGAFEEEDLSMWTLESDASTFRVVDDNPGAAMGLRVLNFWSDADYTFSVSQDATGLDAGTFRAQVSVHGADEGTEGYDLQLVVTTSEGEWSAPLQLDGWQAWYEGHITDIQVGADGAATVAVVGDMGAGDWGFIDEIVLTGADS